MKVIKIEVIGNYNHITEAAGITRGNFTHHAPSLETFEKWLISEHSPIRRVQVAVTISAPPVVISHFVRHIHALHYVQTSRPDITGTPRENREKYYLIQANLQEWLQISRARLCRTAAQDTQNMMYLIKKAFLHHDNYLAVVSKYMLPKCYHLGRCNEPWGGCGQFPYMRFDGYEWYSG